MHDKKEKKVRIPTPNEDGILIKVINDEICDCCGKPHGGQTFKDGMCDAYTVGMEEKGFAELQVVLFFPLEIIGYILNTVAKKVINGEVEEKDGTVIEGLFRSEAALRLDKRRDADGKDIYRVIIPDARFRMPEESDEYPYNMQCESPYLEGIA